MRWLAVSRERFRFVVVVEHQTFSFSTELLTTYKRTHTQTQSQSQTQTWTQIQSVTDTETTEHYCPDACFSPFAVCRTRPYACQPQLMWAVRTQSSCPRHIFQIGLLRLVSDGEWPWGSSCRGWWPSSKSWLHRSRGLGAGSECLSCSAEARVSHTQRAEDWNHRNHSKG